MYAQGKIEALEKTLRTVATLSGVPSLIVLGLYFFFGGSILGIVFGKYYQIGGAILAVLSVGQLANVLAGSCGLTLMLTGHQFTIMMITICCGLSAVVGAWWLVQPYGGLGVACVASAGMILQNLLMLLCAKKKVGIWTHVNPLLIKDFKGLL